MKVTGDSKTWGFFPTWQGEENSLELGHQVRGRALESQPCVTAAAAGELEGWGRLESALLVTSAYMGPAAALWSVPCVLQQYLSAWLWYRQDWAGGGDCSVTSVRFSRQPPVLIMPGVDPNALLSSSCKLVLRNNCNLF